MEVIKMESIEWVENSTGEWGLLIGNDLYAPKIHCWSGYFFGYVLDRPTSIRWTSGGEYRILKNGRYIMVFSKREEAEIAARYWSKQRKWEITVAKINEDTAR